MRSPFRFFERWVASHPEINIWRILPVTMLLLAGSLCLPGQDFNVMNYGAVADGKTLNTIAIQKALDAAGVQGGRVIIPAGTFLSGTIRLHDNVSLYLSKGSVLLGSTELSTYPYLESGLDFYGHAWAKQALIFSKGLKNVSIEGEGTIDGQGAAFKVTTNQKPDRYRNRPYLLWFVDCKNVRVSGVSLRNSAFWMQHYLGCETVRITGINIWNHSNKNNDMLDIDGCKDVMIRDIKGDSDDDGLTLKSTSPLVSENVTISDCILSSHCNGLKLGTESTGGFRNVTISDCVIKPSAQRTTIYGLPNGNSGISLEMVDGGVMENILINNIVIEGPQVPIFVRLGNRARKFTDTAKAPAVGIARNIIISNIIATGADTIGCSITGISNNYLENITLSNISLEFSGGGTAGLVSRKIEELETLYPEGTMFGKLPAYGIYARHVRGLKLDRIRTRFKANDFRPAIFLTDVKDYSLENTDLQSAKNITKTIIQK